MLVLSDGGALKEVMLLHRRSASGISGRSGIPENSVVRMEARREFS